VAARLRSVGIGRDFGLLLLGRGLFPQLRGAGFSRLLLEGRLGFPDAT
jgi:hypothetical protein